MIDSLDPNVNMENIQTSGEGAGASGSFFFYCQNHRYTIKTMNKTEIKHMQRMLPDYVDYLEKNAMNSRLALILGMFSFKIDQYSEIRIMIMSNVKPDVDNTSVKYIFDMKGSQINRSVIKWRELTDIQSMSYTKNKVMKDIDFTYLKRPKKIIQLEDHEMCTLVQNIQNDVQFLMRNGFMDYSLLLCVR